MAQIATTIEQSRKLIELGIDVKTADMHWHHYIIDNTYELSAHKIEDIRVYDNPNEIPSWSLSALMELMPASIIYGYSEDDLYLLNIYKDDYKYFVEYRKEIKSKISNCYITKFEELSENLIDAVFNVTCHLLKNKLI